MKQALIIICGSILMSSCAAIFSGKKITVVSSNPGATTEVGFSNPWYFFWHKTDVESNDTMVELFVSRYMPVHITQYKEGYLPCDTFFFTNSINHLLLTDLIILFSAGILSDKLVIPEGVAIASFFTYFISQMSSPWVQNSQKTFTTGSMTHLPLHDEKMKYVSKAQVTFSPTKDKMVIQYYNNGRKYITDQKSNTQLYKSFDLVEEKKLSAFLSNEQLNTLMDWGYYDSTGYIDPNPNNFVAISSEVIELSVDATFGWGVRYKGLVKLELRSATNNEILVSDTLHVQTRLLKSTPEIVKDEYLAELMMYSMQMFLSDSLVKIQLARDSSDFLAFNQDNSLLEISRCDSCVSSIEDAKRAVVSVSSKNGIASGCLISSEGYILASSEIAQNCKVVIVGWSDGREQEATVIRTNRQEGLCLLKVSSVQSKPFLLKSDKLLSKGDDVLSVATDFGLGTNTVVSKGIVSGIRTIRGSIWYQSDVPINRNNLGGALIDNNFNLYGILHGQIAEVEGIGFVIPIVSVEKALNIHFYE